MNFEERYKVLNAAQRDAVDSIDGPVMVIAGPGTGKTELLGVRAANILKKTDTLPENILCLTFSEAGAAEMRERLVSIIGRDAYKIGVFTFHGFGTDVISNNREAFYNGAEYHAADDIARYEILRTLFEQLAPHNIIGSQQNGEFSYLGDVRTAISEIKKSGFTSEEFRHILNTNDLAIDIIEKHLAPLFEPRLSAKILDPLETSLALIRAIDDEQSMVEIPALSRIAYDSLAAAVNEARSLPTRQSTAPIKRWRDAWFEKNEQGNYCMKDRKRQEKLRATVNLYGSYVERMSEAASYDFDDMILQVVHALEHNDNLRFNLQEKYQYIMVDEFQDTNIAQMRIVRALTDNPVNEGKPNILVVGDDDQAIFSFQGADISNILSFKEFYPATKQIVLTENYRSASPILNYARDVITKGEDRLENHLKELSKVLHAQHDNGAVLVHEAETTLDERRWLAESIAADIAGGTAASDIAVITRNHKYVLPLLPFFARANIAVSYERSDNVLDMPPIIQLQLLARVITYISNSRFDEADALLPEIVSHPAWKFNTHDIHDLAVSAYDSRTRWLETMHTKPAFSNLYEWLIELSIRARYTPLEVMLDLLLGRPSEHVTTLPITSPLYDFYFSTDVLEQDPEAYLLCLSGMRTLRRKLEEYKLGETLLLESFNEFIELMRQIKGEIKISSLSNERTDNAINVMTAHKSKGLEFKIVYVIGATDNVWGESSRSRSRWISYPENIPLENAGSTADERLRLFYVALTRAKQTLHVSYALHDDNEKSQLRADFLGDEQWQGTPIASLQTADEITEALETDWWQPLARVDKDVKKLLAPQIARYKLSATDLNAFLDVTNGGPENFFLERFLHFPSAPSANLCYGTAIHKTLQLAHEFLTRTGEKRPIEDVLGDFASELKNYRMNKVDYDTFLQRGSVDLPIYLRERYDTFTTTQKTELSFAGQNVVIGDALLTGKIDLVSINKDEKAMYVTDYKTGHAARDWKGKTDYEKVKMHKYMQQLTFYKLLIENSRDYKEYQVPTAALEFIEPTRDEKIIVLPADLTQSGVDHLKTLIDAVWQHIVTLNFPDTSHYPANQRGIAAFEQDLIDGAI